MGRTRKYSTDSSDDDEGHDAKRLDSGTKNTRRRSPRQETARPGATGRKTSGREIERPKTTGSKTTEPKATGPKATGPETTGPKATGPGPKTTGPKATAPKTTARKTTAPKTTAPKTTGPRTTEPKTEGQEISNPENFSTAAEMSRSSDQKQLLAPGASQDSSSKQENASRSNSTSGVDADRTSPPRNDDESRLPQEEIFPAMLPAFQHYLKNYEDRTHTHGRHTEDYHALVRDFQRTMTPLFQKYLHDRIEQMIESGTGPQLLGNEALQSDNHGNTSDTSLQGRVPVSDEVSAAALQVDRPGTWLSLKSQLPQIFEYSTANAELESTWVWDSDLMTIRTGTEKFWRLAFFLGIFLYLDEASLERLQEKIPGRPCKLLGTEDISELQELVTRRDGANTSLVLRRTRKFDDPTTFVRPSFSTLSPDALSWHVSPWLGIAQKEELQSLWDSLPAFDPKSPNRDLSDPDLPAEPEELEHGEYSWKDCYQPLRWFFCPCALRKHNCAFTGEAPANCRGWHAVCCQEVCSHGPATNLVHVGPLCTHVYEGKVCPWGQLCHFRHGVDVEAKGIEHRLLHHRKYFPEDTRAGNTQAQWYLS